MARKGLYEKWLTDEGLTQIRGWARNGLSFEQIAHNISISRKTLNEWRKKYPEIDQVLTESREQADLIVENELFERARGYNAKVVKHVKLTETTIDGGIKTVKETLVPVEEEVHIPADVKAQTFWLSHRKSAAWGKLSEDGAEASSGGIVLLPSAELKIES